MKIVLLFLLSQMLACECWALQTNVVVVVDNQGGFVKCEYTEEAVIGMERLPEFLRPEEVWQGGMFFDEERDVLYFALAAGRLYQFDLHEFKEGVQKVPVVDEPVFRAWYNYETASPVWLSTTREKPYEMLIHTSPTNYLANRGKLTVSLHTFQSGKVSEIKDPSQVSFRADNYARHFPQYRNMDVSRYVGLENGLPNAVAEETKGYKWVCFARSKDYEFLHCGVNPPGVMIVVHDLVLKRKGGAKAYFVIPECTTEFMFGNIVVCRGEIAEVSVHGVKENFKSYYTGNWYFLVPDGNKLYKLALGKYEEGHYGDNTQAWVYYAKGGIAYVVKNDALFLVPFKEENSKPRCLFKLPNGFGHVEGVFPLSSR